MAQVTSSSGLQAFINSGLQAFAVGGGLWLIAAPGAVDTASGIGNTQERNPDDFSIIQTANIGTPGIGGDANAVWTADRNPADGKGSIREQSTSDLSFIRIVLGLFTPPSVVAVSVGGSAKRIWVGTFNASTPFKLAEASVVDFSIVNTSTGTFTDFLVGVGGDTNTVYVVENGPSGSVTFYELNTALDTIIITVTFPISTLAAVGAGGSSKRVWALTDDGAEVTIKELTTSFVVLRTEILIDYRIGQALDIGGV